MIYKSFMLYDEYGLKSDYPVKFSAYVMDNSNEMDINRKRPAVLVLPGGGYAMTSDREAEPIVFKFLSAGFAVFLLRYSVAPSRHPKPIQDAALAVSYIRKNAESYNVDKDKIAVCGFSAGGHLAASLGTLWNNESLFEGLPIEKGSNQPNALILSYPVISAKEFAHEGSIINLLGDNPPQEQRELYNLHRRVGKQTPPSFIWHTFEDTCVPVENSLMFAKALRENDIPFELHIFPNGYHGLSLADTETNPESIDHVSHWMKLCIEWLKELFRMKF